MELWVRSQDKRILMKVDTIMINRNNEYEIVANYGRINPNSDGLFILGKYRTQKRIKEIFDEIQELIQPEIKLETDWNNTFDIGGIMYYKNEATGYIKQPDSIVYNMPKE